mmetsp:Transcript_37393/g.116261  ORF Transcript_37393/g.116261 Transcript_37393/m.116261 type:complete len:276 (-) Transcript_37393:193-1020(-)
MIRSDGLENDDSDSAHWSEEEVVREGAVRDRWDVVGHRILEGDQGQQAGPVHLQPRAHVVLRRRHGQGGARHQDHQVCHEEDLPDVEPLLPLDPQLDNKFVREGRAVQVDGPGLGLLHGRDVCRFDTPLGKERLGANVKEDNLHRLVVVSLIFLGPPNKVKLLQVDDLPVEGKILHVEDLVALNGERGRALPIDRLVGRPLACRVVAPCEVLPYPALLHRDPICGHADAWDAAQPDFGVLLGVEGPEGPVALHPDAEGAGLWVERHDPDRCMAPH